MTKVAPDDKLGLKEMKKFLLISIFIISISTVNAQWHFSITSMSYNDNCSGLQAMMEVEVKKTVANTYAAKEYGTKEECESMRSKATMNWSNSGCYIRTTTSPCTGGNTGGGGTGEDGAGSGFQAGSLYNSIAIGENYFTPNVAHSIPDQGRELEIKLEALNKQFQNATNGIKTGDRSFDKTYRKQSNDVSTPKDKDENIEEMYAFIPRIPKVYLNKENDFSDGVGGQIVPIDPERIRNQEWEERREKSLKETQHRIDSIAEKNQRKIDSINKRQNKTNNPAILVNSNEDKSSLGSFISETYQIGTGFIRKADEGVKYYNETFGITIPGGEKVRNLNAELNNLEDGFKDLGVIVVYSFIGDTPGLTSKFKEIIHTEVIDPLKDMAFNTANSLTNKYTNTKDMLKDVGNPLKKSVVRLTDTILKGALKAEKSGDYGAYYNDVTKERLRFGNNVAKIVKKQVTK